MWIDPNTIARHLLVRFLAYVAIGIACVIGLVSVAIMAGVQ